LKEVNAIYFIYFFKKTFFGIWRPTLLARDSSSIYLSSLADDWEFLLAIENYRKEFYFKLSFYQNKKCRVQKHSVFMKITENALIRHFTKQQYFYNSSSKWKWRHKFPFQATRFKVWVWFGRRNFCTLLCNTNHLVSWCVRQIYLTYRIKH